MIILVLSMHSADTYSPFGNWYYTEYTRTGLPTLLFFGFYQSFLQAFFMALLFSMMGDAYVTGLARAHEARERRLAGAEAAYVPAVAEDGGDVAMPLREAYEYYGTPRGSVPNYVNRFAVESRMETLPFDALSVAHLIE